jgi:hypothetical protein
MDLAEDFGQGVSQDSDKARVLGGRVYHRG